jgi:hypothetical protein
MIQFNLLPDVKLEYVKARKLRRTVTTISVLVAAGSLTVLVLLFMANIFLSVHLNNLNNDIEEKSQELKAVPDLDKILTIQNQLNNLTSMHEQKVMASRLHEYISRITPAEATFSELQVDFVENTIKITGKADQVLTINKFVDILKFTTYEIKVEDGEEERKGNAFSNVVLSSFGRDDEDASYEIDISFDPVIFDNTMEVAIIVPNIITTRSVIERPQALFQPIDNENSGGSQ